MGDIIFTARASADLVRLRAFLAHKSPRAARAAANRIVRALDLLLLFPRSGTVIRGDIRRLIVKHGRGTYVARYRIVGEDIQILRIWHGRERRE